MTRRDPSAPAARRPDYINHPARSPTWSHILQPLCICTCLRAFCEPSDPTGMLMPHLAPPAPRRLSPAAAPVDSTCRGRSAATTNSPLIWTTIMIMSWSDSVKHT